MLKDLFKKKISPFESAATLLYLISNNIQDDWQEDKKNIQEFFKYEADDIEKVEILSAVVCMELLAIKNITPNKYESVFSSIIDHLLNEENYGSYIVTSIKQEYIPIIFESKEESFLPVSGICYILSKKFGFSYDILTENILLGILISKTGHWKSINEKFKIV